MKWTVIEFQNLYGEPSRNGLYKSKEFHGSGIRIVNMKELFAFPMIGNQEMQLLRVTDSELNKFGLQTGDLLFARRSLVEEGSGKCVLIVEHEEPIVFESSMIRVRLNKNCCYPLFYYYYFQSPTGRLGIKSIITGAGQKGIRGTDLAKVKVYHPPIPEQKAIAQALSDADAAIAELDRLITKKRNIKQGTMQQLLTGKKRLQGFSEEIRYKQTGIGVIPEDWGVDKIDALASITTGSRNTQDRIDDGEYPFFVRSQTVERINSYSFDGEAVLTAGDGVGTGKIFHYINGKFDFHQRVYRISHFTPKLNGFFFYKYFSNHFYDRIMSMTAKSSVDSVRMEMIADMLVPLPQPEEQKAIAQVLTDMDTEIEALEQKRDKYKAIKQGMMQELLTGRTRLV